MQRFEDSSDEGEPEPDLPKDNNMPSNPYATAKDQQKKPAGKKEKPKPKIEETEEDDDEPQQNCGFDFDSEFRQNLAPQKSDN